MINNKLTSSDLYKYLDDIATVNTQKFLINGGETLDFVDINGKSRKGVIEEYINDVKTMINNQSLIGQDVQESVHEFLKRIYNTIASLYDKKPDQSAFELSFNKTLLDFKTIKGELEAYLESLKSKINEYGAYYEKIEIIVGIENNIFRISNNFDNIDFNAFNDDETKILKDIDGKLKFILSELAVREKYKFWLILSTNFLRNKASYFSSFQSEQNLYDTEYLQQIDIFYGVISKPAEFIGDRRFWIDNDLQDASFRLEQAKEVALLSRILNSKIRQIDKFSIFEKEVVKKHQDGVEQYKAALGTIEEQVDISKGYVEEILSEKGAVLQYSEKLKNTPAIMVYSKIYSDEIKIANTFRFAALIIFSVFSFLSLLCLSILFFGDASNPVSQNLTETKRIFAKIPFILAFIIFGYYLAREGEKHRKIANQAKQTEAELTALDSYTTNWEKSEIRDLKIMLADKYFGRDVNNIQANSNNTIIEQVKAGTELVKASTDVIKTFNIPTKPGVSTENPGTTPNGT